MNEPREPRRMDLRDEALFASFPGQGVVPTDAPDRIVDAVRLALRGLRSANLNPGFGFSMDDAVETWSAKLRAYDPEAIAAATGELISATGGEFPTLAEFETLVASVHRRAHAPAERPDGTPCPECREFRGQSEKREGRVNLTDPTLGGIGTSRPCSLCRPVQHELWQAEHYGPREMPSLCRCGHEECPDAKRLARAKEGV
jgi:hypothetical protein